VIEVPAEQECAAATAAGTVRGRAGSALHLLASCPAWMWVTAIVGVSVLRLMTYAWQLPGPWIIPDELIYAELGRSVAGSAAFSVRDEATQVYAIVYAIVIAPAYLLWNEPESSYRAVKTINSIAMSLAAVPVYLLARRFTSSGWAVAMAALAITIPSMAYTGVVMTENVFYPLFLLAALAMVAALERPTRRRQLLLLGAIGAATLTRPQAIVMLPAFASAMFLVKFVEARTRATPQSNSGGHSIRLRSYRLLWMGMVGTVLVAVALSAIRGTSPLDVFGVYRHAFGAIDLSEALRMLLYQFAVLDLSVAVVPFAAAIALTLSVRNGISRSLLHVWAVTVSLTVSTLILVAVVSARSEAGAPGYPALPPRIHERYFFYLAPLFFLLALGYFQQRRGIRTSVIVSAAVAGLLPAILPIEKFKFNARFESPALVPWFDTSLAPALVVFTATLAVLFVACCRRSRAGLSMIIVGLALYTGGLVAQNGMLNLSKAIAGSVHASDASWVDHRVGPGERVAVVVGPADSATSRQDRFDRGLPIWYSEFFNKSLGRVYYLGERLPYNLPDEPVTVDPASHSLLDSSGRELRVRWALADSNVRLEGTVVAKLDSGLRLYRITGKGLRVKPG
jgi:hypothetical protein